MKLRKLARLCEHDQLEAHDFGQHSPRSGRCPGGVFLPDDTLVIERPANASNEFLKIAGTGAEWLIAESEAGRIPDFIFWILSCALEGWADALSVREAE